VPRNLKPHPAAKCRSAPPK